MSQNPEKTLVRQGWLQTGLVLLTLIATVLLTFARLDAKADTAMATAIRAEIKAVDVDSRTHEMKTELVAIRTVLEERLPNSNAGMGR